MSAGHDRIPWLFELPFRVNDKTCNGSPEIWHAIPNFSARKTGSLMDRLVASHLIACGLGGAGWIAGGQESVHLKREYFR